MPGSQDWADRVERPTLPARTLSSPRVDDSSKSFGGGQSSLLACPFGDPAYLGCHAFAVTELTDVLAQRGDLALERAADVDEFGGRVGGGQPDLRGVVRLPALGLQLRVVRRQMRGRIERVERDEHLGAVVTDQPDDVTAQGNCIVELAIDVVEELHRCDSQMSSRAPLLI